MASRIIIAHSAAALAACAAPAQAQSADALAEQWRAAKRQELLAQQAAIAAQLAALPNALPDPVAAAPRQPTPAPAPAPAPAAAAVADAAAVKAKQDAATEAGNRSFAGLEFGVGLSFTIDIGKRDRIGNASIVNGLVRVGDENNDRARVMLESHYLFTPDIDLGFFGDNSGAIKKWGIGPFIALQPGTDEVIEAIGMGVMIGFRRAESGQSFNLGFGYAVDPNTQVLGDDIRANAPLPVGETEIRYKNVAQTLLLILSSFSF